MIYTILLSSDILINYSPEDVENAVTNIKFNKLVTFTKRENKI